MVPANEKKAKLERRRSDFEYSITYSAVLPGGETWLVNVSRKSSAAASAAKNVSKKISKSLKLPKSKS
jgi:hypothetical protein